VSHQQQAQRTIKQLNLQNYLKTSAVADKKTKKKTIIQHQFLMRQSLRVAN
jgi:hypothetical protein